MGFRSILRMCVQNLKFAALPVPEIIGGTQNFGQTLETPFKVTQGHDFGAIRKRVYDFLLVRHSNLGPILHRFGDIAGFCAPE